MTIHFPMLLRHRTSSTSICSLRDAVRRRLCVQKHGRCLLIEDRGCSSPEPPKHVVRPSMLLRGRSNPGREAQSYTSHSSSSRCPAADATYPAVTSDGSASSKLPANSPCGCRHHAPIDMARAVYQAVQTAPAARRSGAVALQPHQKHPGATSPEPTHSQKGCCGHRVAQCPAQQSSTAHPWGSSPSSEAPAQKDSSAPPSS